MEISAQHSFDASPERVAAMLTDREFLDAAVAASHPARHDVSVNGFTTRTVRVLEAPQAARKFTGDVIAITETVEWGDAAPDGSRRGTLTLSAEGLPVTMPGQAVIQPRGTGTVVEYRGDLKVNIPFIGGKMEKEAAPAILYALNAQEKVGQQWLTDHA